jgi:hypothetical protein
MCIVTPKTAIFKVSMPLTLCLLSILLLSQPISAHKMTLSSKGLASFFYYDKSKNMNMNRNEELSMTDGSWYYIKDKKLFEFHPNTVGMIDLTKETGFNRFIYVEAPLRVLVYPVDSNDGKPYVDMSQKKDIGNEKPALDFVGNVIEDDLSETDENCETIFENKNNEMSIEELNNNFSKKINEVFGDEENTLSDLKKRWNVIPRYYPNKAEDSCSDSYINHFYRLKSFRTKMEQSWKIVWNKTRKFEFWTENEKQSLVTFFIKGMLNFMYFDDEDFFYTLNIPLKKKALRLKMDYHWESEHVRFFYANHSEIDADMIQAKFNNIVRDLTKISSKTIYKFFTRENFDYLDFFFKEILGMSMSEKLQEQMAEVTHHPIQNNTLHKYMEILSTSSDLLNNLESPYTGEYKDEIEQVKGFLIESFEAIFGDMTHQMEQLKTPKKQDLYLEALKDPEFQELTKVAGEITEEDLKNKFDANRKEEYIEKYKNANFTRIIVEGLLTIFMPIIKSRVENDLWETEFNSFLEFEKMNMAPNTNAEDLKNIRQLLVIFGQLPVDPELDRPPEVKDVDFLNVVDDGRLLI